MALTALRNLLGLHPNTSPVFFPNAPGVPEDVALTILKKVRAQDLARMCQVSKTWKYFIQAVPSLNNYLIRTACLCMARAIRFDDDSVSFFTSLERAPAVPFKLAMADPNPDLTAAIQALNRSSGPNIYPQAAKRIVRWQARHDLAAAITTSLQHCDVPDLLLEVIKVRVQHDLMGAKALAEMIADQIQNPAVFARALAEIAKASDQDFTAAYAAAGTITDTAEQASTLIDIAKLNPYADLSAIKALVPMMCPWGRSYDVKNQTLGNIVCLEARRDLSAAKKTAETINDSWYQDHALEEIAIVEAMIDPNAAEATAACIKRDYSNTRAYLAIVKVKALYDIEGAIAIAKRNENDEAFVEIVKLQQSLADALATIEMIKDSYYKTLAHLEIAKWSLKHDLTAAKAEAEKIDDFSSDRDKALLKIVKFEVLYDLNDAKATAMKIEDNYYRFKAFLEIVKVAQT